METHPFIDVHIENVNIRLAIQDPDPDSIKSRLSRIETSIAAIRQTQLTIITNMEINMANIKTEFAALKAQVTASTEVGASALVLINGIAARLDAAAGDPVAVAALTAELKASADALSAAVVANTPAAEDPGPVILG